MAEYFDISLIVQKTSSSRVDIEKCLAKKIKLNQGRGVSGYFPGKEILLTNCIDKRRNFVEVSLGIPNLKFHRNVFERELEKLTSFIYSCFEECQELRYALCSYEINGYLLSPIERIEDINGQFLKNFPIVYKREKESNQLKLLLNLEAQDILE